MSASARPIGWDILFGEHSGSDSSMVFSAVIHALLPQTEVVVDVGCGRGGTVQHLDGTDPLDFRGQGRHVIGIDVDPVGTEHPALNEFRLIENERWPLEDNSVDLAVSDWTLEHVTAPEVFVRELARTLRPGGVIVARTVNRNSVTAWGARMVPNRHHARVVGRMQPGRREEDVFPTAYRMNNRKALAALLDREFEWSVTSHGGLHHYMQPWPRMARVARVAEQRFPEGNRLTLLLCARKRAR
ncbi:MAG: class I SAM-dependent methyltransferase [Nocardioidaceae bacterium]|nr:class I SAM-dependent methyltransferase [Nocardioidaceae bacterium]